MKALQLTAWKHDPEMREVAGPEPRPGQVVVRIGGARACQAQEPAGRVASRRGVGAA